MGLHSGGFGSAGNAKTFANAVEFTYSVIPFGSAWLKTGSLDANSDLKDYVEAGVLFVTDATMLAMPIAKFANARGLISTEKLHAVVSKATKVSYMAAGLQTAMVTGKVIQDGGLTWQTSGELIGILLGVGAIKKTSSDVLRAVPANANGLKPGTFIEDVNLSKIGLEAESAVARVLKKVDGELAVPEPIAVQKIESGPNNGKWLLKDSKGNPIEPSEKVYNTIDEARKATHKLIQAKVDARSKIPSAFADELEEGGSWLMTVKQYENFVRGAPIVGRADGQFITSAKRMNELIQETGGDTASLAHKLGANWRSGDQLMRIDVTSPLYFNPRMPTSGMSGANAKFKPGGLTSGGIPEIVVDPMPHKQVLATPITPIQ